MTNGYTATPCSDGRFALYHNGVFVGYVDVENFEQYQGSPITEALLNENLQQFTNCSKHH